MNSITDYPGSVRTIHLVQPHIWLSLLLAWVTTTLATAKGNHVVWYSAGAIRMANGYPVIHLKSFATAWLFPANRTTAVKVLNGKLPIVFSVIAGQRRLTSYVPVVEGSQLVPIVLCVLFALPYSGFTGLFWIAGFPIPYALNMLWIIAFSLSFSLALLFKVSISPIPAILTALFAVVLAPLTAVLSLLFRVSGFHTLFNRTGLAGGSKSFALAAFLVKVFGRFGGLVTADRTGFERVVFHSTHPCAGIHSMIGVSRSDGNRFSGATLDAFNIIPQMGGV